MRTLVACAREAPHSRDEVAHCARARVPWHVWQASSGPSTWSTTAEIAGTNGYNSCALGPVFTLGVKEARNHVIGGNILDGDIRGYERARQAAQAAPRDGFLGQITVGSMDTACIKDTSAIGDTYGHVISRPRTRIRLQQDWLPGSGHDAHIDVYSTVSHTPGTGRAPALGPASQDAPYAASTGNADQDGQAHPQRARLLSTDPSRGPSGLWLPSDAPGPLRGPTARQECADHEW